MNIGNIVHKKSRVSIKQHINSEKQLFPMVCFGSQQWGGIMNTFRIFFFIQRFYDSFTGGKRDEKLILPLNSSVSVTLNQEEVW